jgi:hypothetical protein
MNSTTYWRLSETAHKFPMKTCFISAPANVDLSKLRRLLASKHIKAILPFEQPILGNDFQGEITKAIQKADFCIALLPDEAKQANVFFELGIASAFAKPILLLRTPNAKLPINIWDIPTAEYDPPRFAGLDFYLDQFLRRPLKRRRKRRSSSLKTKPLLDRANQLTAHLQSLGPRATHSELEHILHVAFRESGIRASAEPKEGDRQYDFAIWVDELSGVIGNPLLIEVKSTLSLADAKRLRDTFIASIPKALGRALLVVYSTGSQAIENESVGSPLVLFVNLQRLLATLRARSLGTFIRSERNRLVHGF